MRPVFSPAVCPPGPLFLSKAHNQADSKLVRPAYTTLLSFVNNNWAESQADSKLVGADLLSAAVSPPGPPCLSKALLSFVNNNWKHNQADSKLVQPGYNPLLSFVNNSWAESQADSPINNWVPDLREREKGRFQIYVDG